MSNGETTITPPYILREQRLESTPVPEWFDLPTFIDGLRLFYQRVEIGLWYTARKVHVIEWFQLTPTLARKYGFLEHLRTTDMNDSSIVYDTSIDRDSFIEATTAEIISIFISCIKLESLTVFHLARFASIIDRILLVPELFNAPLHRNTLLSFGSWVEYHTREFDSECVKDKLKKACKDCGIEVPDVLE